jgi:hypothetical protein
MTKVKDLVIKTSAQPWNMFIKPCSSRISSVYQAAPGIMNNPKGTWIPAAKRVTLLTQSTLQELTPRWGPNVMYFCFIITPGDAGASLYSLLLH